MVKVAPQRDVSYRITSLQQTTSQNVSLSQLNVQCLSSLLISMYLRMVLYEGPHVGSYCVCAPKTLVAGRGRREVGPRRRLRRQP